MHIYRYICICIYLYKYVHMYTYIYKHISFALVVSFEMRKQKQPLQKLQHVDENKIGIPKSLDGLYSSTQESLDLIIDSLGTPL